MANQQQQHPPPYRFVRLNPRFDAATTLAQLQAQVAQEPYPLPVPWLEGFYALPSDFAVHQSDCFQTARLYGQDVSSGAAVAALLTNRYDRPRTAFSSSVVETAAEPTAETPLRVLDMCCCPGLKLCAIADHLSTSSTAVNNRQQQQQQQQHTVVGVDVSEQRMAVCKRIVYKYQIAAAAAAAATSTDDDRVRIRLYCNDGTTFGRTATAQRNLVFDSAVAREEEASRAGQKRKRINKSAKARLQKRLKEVASLDSVTTNNNNTNNDNDDDEVAPAMSSSQCQLRLFDRVLVDAECSTDGSVVHAQKRRTKPQTTTKGWSTDDPEQMTQLVDLQRKLASNGYRLLRPGGCMVYSTCSLDQDQNEGVVRWLLQEFPEAQLVPVDFTDDRDTEKDGSNDLVQEGTLPGTVRFLPNACDDEKQRMPNIRRLYGGGFFLAKIVKTTGC